MSSVSSPPVGVVGTSRISALEKVGVKTELGAIVVDALQPHQCAGISPSRRSRAAAPCAQGRTRRRYLRRSDQGPQASSHGQAPDPGCTYCSPQIASVGLTEQAAKDKKLDIRVGRFPFVGNGKAIALGEDQGLVKVIFEKKTGELLGAHMVGAEVTELIRAMWWR